MIQQGIYIDEKIFFRVLDFCKQNNVEFSENVFESINGGVVGEVNNVIKVLEFIDKLNKEK